MDYDITPVLEVICYKECLRSFGMPYIQPVHQGRAAEKVLLPIFVCPKDFNMRLTQPGHVACRARTVDCVVPGS